MDKYTVKVGHKGDQFFITERSADRALTGKSFKICKVRYTKAKAEALADEMNSNRIDVGD